MNKPRTPPTKRNRPRFQRKSTGKQAADQQKQPADQKKSTAETADPEKPTGTRNADQKSKGECAAGKKLIADIEKPSAEQTEVTADPTKQAAGIATPAAEPGQLAAEPAEEKVWPRRTGRKTTQPQRLGMGEDPQLRTVMIRDPLNGWSQTLFRLWENLNG